MSNVFETKTPPLNIVISILHKKDTGEYFAVGTYFLPHSNKWAIAGQPLKGTTIEECRNKAITQCEENGCTYTIKDEVREVQ